MASVSVYLNFTDKTEEAFNFYKGVFGTEFGGPIMRYGEAPPSDEFPISEEQKNLVMHMSLPILGDTVLMGSDVVGRDVNAGNNVSLMLMPDTRAEADTLFNALSAGGTVTMPMAEQFWGDYFGSFTDKFGIQWQIDTEAKE